MAKILIVGRDWQQSNHLRSTLKKHNHKATCARYYREVLRRVNAGETFDVIICDTLEEFTANADYDQLVKNLRKLLAPATLFIAEKHASPQLASQVNAIPIKFLDFKYNLETWDELTILSHLATPAT